MSIGLPGSGIGGVFYLMSAVWMPMHSVQRKVRGEAPKARMAVRQSVLAVLIIGALWSTGVAVEWIIGVSSGAAALKGSADAASAAAPGIFRAASFLLTFGTLAGVLMLVQVLRLFVRPARELPRAPRRTEHKKAA